MRLRLPGVLHLSIHGASPERDFDMAMDMVITGKPSQIARKLVKLICKDKKPLVNCCCATAVSSRWKKLIPKVVKTSVASLDFKSQFDQVLRVADDVWEANQESHSVAAMSIMRPVGTPAGAARNPPAADMSGSDAADVAAVSQRGRGQGRGRRRGGQGQGQGRGGGRPNQAKSAGEEVPPSNCCKMHLKHGKNAFYCTNEKKCPWRDFKKKPPQDDD